MKNVIKKIHQIWDKDIFPKDFEKYQLSLKNKHLDWQYTLWDLNKCRNLIKKEYSYFLDTFDNFKFNIEKIDAARFFILDFEGGFYADLDIFFYKNLEDLLIDKKAVFFNRKEDHYICNSIMYNNNSIFFKKLCRQLKYLQKLFYDKNKNDVINVLNTNGQHFLYNFYNINKYDSDLLSSKYFEFYNKTEKYKNEDFIYGIHEYANTWFEKTKVLV
tara:strand:- start:325 stop:972 length:648 start_codon:yes stop_codon:yes gene_type:complete